ncbi:MAG: hypothetical protein LBO74_00620 [Candidatus Symbiothrix sp.]|jgi:hypothetical protein|nr:hypothetical protein [Candidatus Symbiothrix sp.]
MRKNYFVWFAITLFVSIAFSACKSSSQKTASERGIKQKQEECQKMAVEQTKGWRASGNGLSPKESFAINLATLDARSNLSEQIRIQVEGLIQAFNQQHSANGAIDLVGKESQIQKGYFDELLAGSKVICQNTYVKKDGSYNAYVCIEMSDDSSTAIYKKLSNDKKLSINLAEPEFKKELEKDRNRNTVE